MGNPKTAMPQTAGNANTVSKGQPINDPISPTLPPILTVLEVAAYLRIGRTVAYELVRIGAIPSIRLGHQIRIVRDTLFTWQSSGGLMPSATGTGTAAGMRTENEKAFGSNPKAWEVRGHDSQSSG